MNDEIQNLLDSVPASRGAGKYLDQLTQGGRETLALFESWLKTDDNKSDATARAYKGYVAKALVEITNDPNVELDTDVKSAVNALRRFQASGYIEANVEADEIDAAGDEGNGED